MLAQDRQTGGDCDLTEAMTKETKELVRPVIITLVVMMAIPLAYRVGVALYPPDSNSRPTLAQYVEETRSERALKLLTTPPAKWTEADAKSEPEIYAWLKEQEDEILPWEWTEEARRKDPDGYVKGWRRIWKGRKAFHAERLERQQKERKRLDREIENLTTLQIHRTNQIARLRAVAATRDFPCKVTLEHLEKGRFWGWNKRTETVACQEASALKDLIAHSLDPEVLSCQASMDKMKAEAAEVRVACRQAEALRDRSSACVDILESRIADEKGIRALEAELVKNLQGRPPDDPPKIAPGPTQ